MGKKVAGKQPAKKPETKAEAKAAKEKKIAAQKAEAHATAKEAMLNALALKNMAVHNPGTTDLEVLHPAPSTARSSGSDKDPAEVENARKKKLLQSNLKGQVVNAIAKLTSSDQGKIFLTPSTRSDLEQKVKFGRDYAQLHDQKRKDEMLLSFKEDRSCKAWATFTSSYEKSETVLQTKVNGYGTR
jgi:hypothetical protein